MQTITTPHLLPCPHCGNASNLETGMTEDDESGYVCCIPCECTIAKDTVEEAVTVWNTRQYIQHAGTIQ